MKVGVYSKKQIPMEEENSQTGETKKAAEPEKSLKERLRELAMDKKLKICFENTNVNFLIGSGLSCPYLSTLSNIEDLLSKVELENESELKKCVIASIYKKFFENVIYPCKSVDSTSEDNVNNYIKTRLNYADFIKILYNLIQRRKKVYGVANAINIFTTNIDDFFEIGLEESGVMWNSGFTGLRRPKFDESNFSRSYSMTSRYYSRISEIPVFNLIKMHGSINWGSDGKDTKKIVYDNHLEILSSIHEKLSLIPEECFCKVSENVKVDDLYAEATTISPIAETYTQFLEEYEKLIIVNPTKKKFSTTVIDSHFYELMRIYSNTLEKPNSVLFVHGFSFADEHIAQLTMRAANTNPTLQIYVFAYQEKEKTEIANRLGITNAELVNKNINIVSLPDAKLDFQNINILYDSIWEGEIRHD